MACAYSPNAVLHLPSNTNMMASLRDHRPPATSLVPPQAACLCAFVCVCAYAVTTRLGLASSVARLLEYRPGLLVQHECRIVFATCIQINMCVCTHISVCVWVCACVCVCVCVCVCACVCAQVLVCVCVCMFVCVHVSACVRLCVYVRMTRGVV